MFPVERFFAFSINMATWKPDPTLTFSETLSLSRAITINLHGGQNVGYTAQTGITTIKGMVTIVKGCLVVDRVTIM